MGATPARLRRVLRAGAPAKLFDRGARRGFCRVRCGKRVGNKLHGLTRRLDERLFSTGKIPWSSSGRRRGDPWGGRGGGRRRGVAVDAQLAAIANGRKPPVDQLYRLTRIALSALRAREVSLVCGGQPVVSDRGNLASAVDLVGTCRDGTELVLIELKTGYAGGRLDPAMADGTPQRMRPPLSRALDCLAHRHLSQLAATVAMFVSDRAMMRELTSVGVSTVSGILVYVTDTDVEVIELIEWWKKRGSGLVRALK